MCLGNNQLFLSQTHPYFLVLNLHGTNLTPLTLLTICKTSLTPPLPHPQPRQAHAKGLDIRQYLVATNLYTHSLLLTQPEPDSYAIIISCCRNVLRLQACLDKDTMHAGLLP